MNDSRYDSNNEPSETGQMKLNAWDDGWKQASAQAQPLQMSVINAREC